MNIENFSSQDLVNVAQALAIVCGERIMAQDYAKLVWKEVLRKTGLEVTKPIFEKKEEIKKI